MYEPCDRFRCEHQATQHGRQLDVIAAKLVPQGLDRGAIAITMNPHSLSMRIDGQVWLWRSIS
jgi:hypothetical protein